MKISRKIDNLISDADNFLNEALAYDIEDRPSLMACIKDLKSAKRKITQAESLLKTESVKLKNKPQ